MILRPYQEGLIRDVVHRMTSGTRSMIVQSPTGSGKTVLIARMAMGAKKKGNSAWIFSHRREVKDQIEETLGKLGALGGQNQVFTIQSRSHKSLPEPSLVIWDEAHHCRAATWQKIKERTPGAYHVGFTATPCRLDGKGLGTLFDDLIIGPSVLELIRGGYLCNYRLIAPPSGVDVTGTRTLGGDYRQDDLERAVDRPTITGCAVDEYLSHCAGRQAVAFCVSVEHSEHVAEQFSAAGVSAAHISGKTPKGKRKDLVNRFRQGYIKVLTNCNLFTEGFDVPGIEACIMLRPTKSLALYMQMAGRALRYAPGKTARIIDHVGGWKEHGLPCDDREWSLDDKVVRVSSKGATICPKCFSAQRSGVTKCIWCGEMLRKPRDRPKPLELQVVDGKLEEVDIEKARKKRVLEEKDCKTFDDFVALGVRRGYAYPKGWAKHRMRIREHYGGRGNSSPKRDTARSPEPRKTVPEQRGVRQTDEHEIRSLQRLIGPDWMDGDCHHAGNGG